MKNKKILLKELFIISPFKGRTVTQINKTIYSLKKNNSFIRFNHLIIFDKTSKKIINSININNLKTSLYKIEAYEINENGIYNAINFALRKIPFNSFYIVLGAGDLVKEISGKILLNNKSNIIIFPYILSFSENKKYISSLRPFKSGMPYCHNAIAFRNNGIKYNTNYSISADYDYFLNYICFYKLNKKKVSNEIQTNLKVEFESLTGISSNSKLKKNIQNILIIYKKFRIFGIIVYFWHTLKRILRKFWMKSP